ncbi:hypothetical protein KW795_02770 [Candidatus Microgenomates bacterium]|nr:hypothetical protein [Candidatus Microgenomates bacterium]
MKKITAFVILVILLWQMSGLIPYPVKLLYPNFNSAAKNQFFIFDSRFSIFPGSLTGCLYFPDIYDSLGMRIQTESGRLGKQFIAPDHVNNPEFPIQKRIVLKIRAECGVGGYTLYKFYILEKSYNVEDKIISMDEKISIFNQYTGRDKKEIEMLFKE